MDAIMDFDLSGFEPLRPQIVAALRRLQAATDDALEAAYERQQNGERIDGAIKWGDLRCVDACLVMGVNGRAYYRVEIEEAAPDNDGLKDFVWNWLNAAGFGDVEVITEW